MSFDLSEIPQKLRKAFARSIIHSYQKGWSSVDRQLQACRELAVLIKDPELQNKIETAQRAINAVRDSVLDVILALQKKETP